MPAPATPIDQLSAEQRAVLDQIARVTAAIAQHNRSMSGLTAERHALFLRAAEAGVAVVTIAQVAGVSQPAVSKVLQAKGGGQ